MVRIGLMACIIVLIGCAHQSPVGGGEEIARLKDGVVKVTATEKGKTRVGTGFVVKFDPEIVYIVTAAHVVSNDPQPMVQFFSRQEVQVRAHVKHAEGGDEVTGMALLTVSGRENIPAGLASLPLTTAVHVSGAEDIMVIGHPRGAGDWAILKGSIASRQGRYLTIDANIDEGNSGGPIIYSREIVGLVGGVTQYGRGVTSSSVREYLEGHGIILQATSMQRAGGVQSLSPRAIKPVHPETLPKEITGKDGAPMVLISAGEFMMGSTKEEVERAIRECITIDEEELCNDRLKSELPQHRMRVESFYLDKYEVSNQLFEQFIQQASYRTIAEREGSAGVYVAGTGDRDVKGANWRQPEGNQTMLVSNWGKHPVVSVSWEDADAFCHWVGKRLPTESEWEYAARAGTKNIYWWGDQVPGTRRVENLADEAAKHLTKRTISGYDDGSVRMAPIGSYEQNPWGLHDMSGNVAEWVADRAGPYEEGIVFRSEHNPKGPSSGKFRVNRGGTWPGSLLEARVATRRWNMPTFRNDYTGFRCAQDAPH